LRHLNSDLSNYNKCPICAVTLVAADLKTVLYSHDAALAIFGDAVSTSHSSVAPGVTEVQVGQPCSFQLLELTRGSLVPRMCTESAVAVHGLRGAATMEVHPAHNAHSKSSAGLTLNQVLPECVNHDALYSRLTCLSIDMMRRLFEHDRQVLLHYRQLCLPQDVSTRDRSTVVSDIPKAPISAAISAWGPPLSAAKTAPGPAAELSQSPPIAAPKVPAWADKRSPSGNIAGGTVKDSISTQPLLPAAQSRGPAESTVGDVEALPYITQALERQQALEAAFEQTVTFDPPVPIVRQASNTNTTGGTSHDGGKATYHVYQHVSGNLIFLHPICAKCILESHTVSTVIAAQLGGNGTANSEDGVSGSQSSAGEEDTATADHSRVSGSIVEIERVRVSEETRQRYNVLRHLPLHSEALLVEIDVAPLVPPHVLCKYSDELGKRAVRRRERAKQEKREKRLEHDKTYVTLG
jgi:hypothetical protein